MEGHDATGSAGRTLHSSIRDLLRSAIGVSLEKAEHLLDRRVSERMEALGVAAADAYVDRLRDDPSEARALAASLIAQETRFFRDPEQFRFLRERVFPDLAARARTALVPHIALLSAGSGTGEEAYSLALILRTDHPDLCRAGAVQIRGIDLSLDAVVQARRGVFLAPRGLQPGFEDHFEAVAGGVRARAELRALVGFHEGNLANDDLGHADRYDLVLCKNVLFYLTDAARARARKALARVLAPGGVLFLSPSEIASRTEGFEGLVEFHEDGLVGYRKSGL